jgi:hypothetical protein
MLDKSEKLIGLFIVWPVNVVLYFLLLIGVIIFTILDSILKFSWEISIVSFTFLHLVEMIRDQDPPK